MYLFKGFRVSGFWVSERDLPGFRVLGIYKCFGLRGLRFGVCSIYTQALKGFLQRYVR